jgi:3-oxoacyl-[acyl-carrier-protein] reductase
MVFFLFSERVAPLVAGLGRGNIVKVAGGVNRAAGCGVVVVYRDGEMAYDARQFL